jgi:hypothetical protein
LKGKAGVINAKLTFVLNKAKAQHNMGITAKNAKNTKFYQTKISVLGVLGG